MGCHPNPSGFSGGDPWKRVVEMPGRNLLVVLFEDASPAELRKAIAERGDGPPHVRVVAPARAGLLEWLATDEDRARAEAEVRALESEWLLADEAEIEGDAGDVDPVLAVEDALRNFDADEILLVGGAAENGGLEASLRRFGIPVTRLDQPVSVRSRSRVREFARGIRSGRSKATPFVLFASVNLTLLVLAALIALLVFAILWLL
jgi:hypothetical protein